MSRGDWPSAAGTRSTLTPPDTSTTSARDNDSCIFLVPPFPRVLRSGGELCDITWGLRQEDLGGIDLRRRGPRISVGRPPPRPERSAPGAPARPCTPAEADARRRICSAVLPDH